ncbi:hypothetical protein AVO44_15845 [Ruegeria profundi]|uniref:TNase-like domain-containing protein n=1 Tax=Ruegeria profundi TaxID=1685378 RepID=A0A0X3TWT4_9RHOB|nr:hypothetical protein AVO44_15845 [Ruegeria profundi]
MKGQVTHVRDADTIEVRGVPIRFDGVDAPELDEPGGAEGKKWMVSNYSGKMVRCVLTGAKTYDRWVGTCFGSKGENLSAGVIAAVLARDCPRYSKGRYKKYETSLSRSRPMKPYCR